MDRSRRNLKPKVYSQPKRKCATIKRDEEAYVYISKSANRGDNRSLIIKGFVFNPNGQIPTYSKTRSFKCKKAKCNARATVSLEDLDKLGICTVRAANEHNHPARVADRRQLRSNRRLGADKTDNEESSNGEEARDSQNEESAHEAIETALESHVTVVTWRESASSRGVRQYHISQ